MVAFRHAPVLAVERMRRNQDEYPWRNDVARKPSGNTLRYFLLGRLAQLGEHRPYKPGVTGSSPVPPTLFFPFEFNHLLVLATLPIW